MDPPVYNEALQRCTDRGFASGVVFDALHLVGAEHAGADALVTFNGADFLRLASPPRRASSSRRTRLTLLSDGLSTCPDGDANVKADTRAPTRPPAP
jgi:hypothetical protein